MCQFLKKIPGTIAPKKGSENTPVFITFSVFCCISHTSCQWLPHDTHYRILSTDNAKKTKTNDC